MSASKQDTQISVEEVVEKLDAMKVEEIDDIRSQHAEKKKNKKPARHVLCHQIPLTYNLRAREMIDVLLTHANHQEQKIAALWGLMRNELPTIVTKLQAVSFQLKAFEQRLTQPAAIVEEAKLEKEEEEEEEEEFENEEEESYYRNAEKEMFDEGD